MRQLDQNAIIAFLRARLAPAAIYLFGSYATGRARDDSDVDIAIVSNTPLEPELLLELTSDLAARLARPVDLIDFARAPETLQAEILRNGIILDCADENQRATIAMRAMSRYQRLNEERAPGLDARLGKDGWKRLS